MKLKEIIEYLQALGFSVYSEEFSLTATNIHYRVYMKSLVISNRIYKCSIIGLVNTTIFYGEIETIDEFKTIWKCLQ